MKFNYKIRQLSILLTLFASVAACSSKEAPIQETLVGNWQVISIQDKAILSKSTVKLTFSSENRLTGSASCNNLSSSFQSKNSALTIGPAATTRKMCLPALMDQESSLLRALSKVKRYQLINGELSLFNQQGVIQLSAKKIK